MADLIDRTELLSNADVFTMHTKEYGSIEVIPVDAVGDAPTVDAVPVVRCEKCKHCLLDLSGREAHLCMYKRKSLLNARVKRDDFCSWGERGEGECKIE